MTCDFLYHFLIRNLNEMLDFFWCMVMYGSVWLYYGYVWLYMVMYGYVWLCMIMYGYLWLCMVTYYIGD